ncbi:MULTISPECIES: aspartate/glutamate racemase family protein [Mesorhizobium]|uniref:aspartate/glutamate racemase family protein n=1 Tax=Mesorhizobium TaxID=68287 RepID=UPI0009F33839|nr:MULTISPECIES: aspartate/glutamate racemase family protein [Mesorhizobium]PBB52926.1 arylsulfatase [Mesorhizobium loti]QIA22538.1 arylsulfatase [Mesorhizobium sp. AA22]
MRHELIEELMTSGSRHTVVFFHTAPALVQVFDELAAELAPAMVIRHVLRPDLLKQAIDIGSATAEIIEAAAEAMLRQTGPHVDAVICTCSTIGQAADLANLQRPVFRIDRPMARRCVELGGRVLVLATVGTTIAPTVELITSEASAAGRTLSVESSVLERARRLFLEGRQDDYLDAIAQGISAATQDADVVVLAQASMAAALPLAKHSAVPVLSSPRIGFEGILQDLSRRVD